MTVWDSGKIRSLIEMAGAAAVLLGLIFVGLELRQNTAAMSAQAVFQLNDSANESHRLMAQDSELAELVHEGHEDPESLSDLERRMFIRWMRARFNLAEAAWIYRNKGLIDEADAAGYQGAICDTMSRKGARWFWDNDFGNYADGFVEDVEKWCGLASE